MITDEARGLFIPQGNVKSFPEQSSSVDIYADPSGRPDEQRRELGAVADAMEAFLRGNRFPASQAAEYGLISRAVPASELDSAVGEVIADLCLGGPDALGAAKRLVYEVPGMESAEAFAWTADLSQRLFKGEEAAAGMRAFLKREKAPWAPPGEGSES